MIYSPLHAAALEYAARRWYVFPLQPGGKEPLRSSRGHLNATTDPKKIDAWWKANPNYNIGCAVAPSNLVVLDVDVGMKSDGTPKRGRESLAEIEHELSPTLLAVTGRGGTHALYERPVDLPPARVIGFRDGLDLIGDGYIVLAPSYLAETHRYYRWTQLHPIALLPSFLHQVSKAPKAIEKVQAIGTPIAEGNRNNALFKLACALRDTGIGAEALARALDAENKERISPPLPDGELAQIVNSALQRVQVKRDVAAGAIVEQEIQQIFAPAARSEWLENVARTPQPPVLFYSTGFNELDNILNGGFATRYLTGIIGPPSTGKPCWEEGLVHEKTRGQIRLADVCEGDAVLTHTGQFKNVSAVFDQGVLPLYTIETRAGRVIKVAGDHTVLTARGWLRADELVETDYLAEVHPAESFGSDTISAEEARLLGYLIGDGHLRNKSGAARFTNADEITLQDFEHCATALGFRTVRSAKRNNKAVCVTLKDPPNPHVDRKGRQRMRNRLGAVRLWCRKHDIEGRNSYNKRVPAVIMTAGPQIIAEYLAAYWACDGGIEDRRDTRKSCVRVEAASVSEQLTRDHQKLFSSLGLSFRLRFKDKNIITQRQGSSYRVWYITARSQDVCAKFMSTIGPRIRNEKASRLPGLKREAFDNVLHADQIRSIKQIGEGRCRCLTVDDDHSFSYEGVAVHNSALVGHWLLLLSQHRPVLHCSLELTRHELFVRYAAHKLNFPWVDGIKGRIDHDSMATAVRGLRIKIFGGEDLDPADPFGSIYAEATRMQQECGIAPIVAIDYIQLMARGAASETRHRVGELTMRARKMSQQLDTVVLGVFTTMRTSYGNKKSEEQMRIANDPTAYLAAAKESGDIEFDCANLMYLDVDKLVEGPTKPGRIAVARVRSGGTVGFVGVRAKLDTGTFWEDAEALREFDSETRQAKIEADTLDKDCQRLLETVEKMPNRAIGDLQAASKLSGSKWKRALEKLLDEGAVVKSELRDNGRRIPNAKTLERRNTLPAPSVSEESAS